MDGAQRRQKAKRGLDLRTATDREACIELLHACIPVARSKSTFSDPDFPVAPLTGWAGIVAIHGRKCLSWQLPCAPCRTRVEVREVGIGRNHHSRLLQHPLLVLCVAGCHGHQSAARCLHWACVSDQLQAPCLGAFSANAAEAAEHRAVPLRSCPQTARPRRSVQAKSNLNHFIHEELNPEIGQRTQDRRSEAIKKGQPALTLAHCCPMMRESNPRAFRVHRKAVDYGHR